MGKQKKTVKVESTRKSYSRRRKLQENERPSVAVNMKKPENHPLLITLVVDKIFEVYKPSLQDLKLFRGVCKSWSTVSCDKLYKSATLKIMKNHAAQQQEGSGVTLTDILSNHGQEGFHLGAKPFKQVKLKGWTFSGKVGEDQDFQKFWDCNGGAIESLQFEGCLFREPKNKPGVLQTVVFEKTPNLKKLLLTDNNMSFTASRRCLTAAPHLNLRSLDIQGKTLRLHVLLSKLPNIEELRIRNGNERIHDHTNFFDSLLPALMIRKDDPTVLNIKHLDVMQTNFFKSSNSKQFYKEALQDIKLPLESLYIDVERRYEWQDLIPTGELLNVLINEFSKTLRVLKIFRRPYALPFQIFPFQAEMEQLTEFYVWGNLTDSLCFLRRMPKLKKLVFDTTCFSKWDDLEKEAERTIQPGLLTAFDYDFINRTIVLGGMDGVVMTHLEFLHSTAYIVSKLEISAMGGWMPNLKVLKVTVFNNDIFSAICSTWPRLRELAILQDSHIDDIGITGRKKYQRRREPSVLDLKELTTFKIDALCHCGLNLFNNRAVYDGFLKMPKLETIAITADWRMTKECEAALRKHIRNVEVYRIKRDFPEKPKICVHLRFWEEMWLGWRFLDRYTPVVPMAL